MADHPIRRFPCPNCGADGEPRSVLARLHAQQITVFCPRCQHRWIVEEPQLGRLFAPPSP